MKKLIALLLAASFLSCSTIPRVFDGKSMLMRVDEKASEIITVEDTDNDGKLDTKFYYKPVSFTPDGYSKLVAIKTETYVPASDRSEPIVPVPPSVPDQEYKNDNLEKKDKLILDVRY